jgi:hypothetical protein
MNSKTTIIFLLVAILALGGYMIAEKKIPSTEEALEKKKKVVDFKAADVVEVGIKGVDRDFIFEKKDSRWELRKPFHVRANGAELEGILGTVEHMQARRSLSARDLADSKLTAADYGLEKPRVIASIKTKDNTFILNIGNEARQGDNLYIQVSGDPRIYLVEKDLAARLGKKLDDYRERGLFDFSANDITRVEIKNGSKFLEISKTNGLWQITQPLSSRADAPKVDAFLNQTTALRADDFLTEEPSALKEHGLEESAQQVILHLSQTNAPQTLLIGQALKTDASKIAVKLNGENSIYAIGAAYTAEIMKPLNEFRDSFLARFQPADVNEVEIRNRQLSVIIRRQGEEWLLVSPEKMNADKELMDQFLSKLSSAQIKDFSTDVLTDLDKYGLRVPMLTYVLRNKFSDLTTTNKTELPLLELSMGKEDLTKKLMYVKRVDESSVYGVASGDIADLPKTSSDLRSRVLFSVKRDQIKSVTRKKGKVSLGVEKGNEGKWALANGTQGVLDEGNWNNLLGKLESFRVEKVMGTALNSNVKQYGLDSPIATLMIQTDENGSPVTREILLSRDNPQKKNFILLKDQLLIAEISRDLHAALTANWIIAPSK